jgi:hypothetical protein
MLSYESAMQLFVLRSSIMHTPVRIDKFAVVMLQNVTLLAAL